MLYFEDVEVGSTRASGEFELTEKDVVDFARIWDPQPFHVDPEAAREVSRPPPATCSVSPRGS